MLCCPLHSPQSGFDVGTADDINVNAFRQVDSLPRFHLYLQKALIKRLLHSQIDIVLGAESYVKKKHVAPASQGLMDQKGSQVRTAGAMTDAGGAVSSQRRLKSILSGTGKTWNRQQRENDLGAETEAA